jgi:hypothetical protein
MSLLWIWYSCLTYLQEYCYWKDCFTPWLLIQFVVSLSLINLHKISPVSYAMTCAQCAVFDALSESGLSSNKSHYIWECNSLWRWFVALRITGVPDLEWNPVIFATDGMSASISWCQAALCVPWPDFTCSLVWYVLPSSRRAPSLTRGRVCIL